MKWFHLSAAVLLCYHAAYAQNLTGRWTGNANTVDNGQNHRRRDPSGRRQNHRLCGGSAIDRHHHRGQARRRKDPAGSRAARPRRRHAESHLYRRHRRRQDETHDAGIRRRGLAVQVVDPARSRPPGPGGPGARRPAAGPRTLTRFHRNPQAPGSASDPDFPAHAGSRERPTASPKRRRWAGTAGTSSGTR